MLQSVCHGDSALLQTLMVWLKSQLLQLPTSLHLASKPEVLMPATSLGTNYLKRLLNPDYRCRVISFHSQELCCRTPVTHFGGLGTHSRVLLSVSLGCYKQRHLGKDSD